MYSTRRSRVPRTNKWTIRSLQSSSACSPRDENVIVTRERWNYRAGNDKTQALSLKSPTIAPIYGGLFKPKKCQVNGNAYWQRHTHTQTLALKQNQTVFMLVQYIVGASFVYHNLGSKTIFTKKLSHRQVFQMTSLIELKTRTLLTWWRTEIISVNNLKHCYNLAHLLCTTFKARISHIVSALSRL